MFSQESYQLDVENSLNLTVFLHSNVNFNLKIES